MISNISYQDIKNNYPNSWHIPYDILLRTIEWREFRQKIIYRDEGKCKICKKEQSEKVGLDYFRKPTEEEIKENLKEKIFDLLGDGTMMVKLRGLTIDGIPTKTPTILHVHHKYYVFGNLPWSYTNDVLITVCHDCHVAIHNTEKILVYVDKSLENILELTPCSRCNGTGFLEKYLHVENGICFRCEGRKFEQFIR